MDTKIKAPKTSGGTADTAALSRNLTEIANTDVQTIAGGPPVAQEYLSSADQETVIGDGSKWRPLEGGDLPPGGGVTVKQDGTTVVADATALNFTGQVNVTDAGGGQVDVEATGTGTGIGVTQDGFPVQATTTTLNVVGPQLEASDDGGGTVSLSFFPTTLVTNTYVADSEDPLPTEIDPADDVSYLQSDGDAEGNALFTLADGDSENDHLLNLSTNQASCTQGVQVQIAHLSIDGGPGTLTIADASAGPAGAILAWNHAAGMWNLISYVGFVAA